MSITGVCPTRSEISGEYSPLMRRYRVFYRADSNDENDGPKTVLDAAGSPTLYSSKYEYGNDSDSQAICVAISTPRRAAGGGHLRSWVFSADFEYNAEYDPALGFTFVEPFYRSESVPVEWAWFKNFYKTTAGAGTPLQVVTKNNPLGFTPGHAMPVSNSNGIPVDPPPEKRESSKGYRVSWLSKTAFDFYPYMNTTNTNTYNIRGYDQPLTDHEPNLQIVGFNKTFSPNTLLLVEAQQPQERIYNRYWYRNTLEFWEGDWCHYELDRGISAIARPGDPDGRGGTWSYQNFPTGAPQVQNIIGPNGEPINEPMLLNGEGKLLTPQDPDKAIFLGYEKYRAVNFSGLPIPTANN